MIDRICLAYLTGPSWSMEPNNGWTIYLLYVLVGYPTGMGTASISDIDLLRYMLTSHSQFPNHNNERAAGSTQRYMHNRCPGAIRRDQALYYSSSYSASS